MEKPVLPDFIIIDDDKFNNLLCCRTIQLSYPEAAAKAFADPRDGIAYMQANYAATDANKAILLLDINMPFLSGWDVLDEFEKFADIVKANIKIYMLSSSISQEDKIRAEKNPLVSGYIMKPLLGGKVEALLS